MNAVSPNAVLTPYTRNPLVTFLGKFSLNIQHPETRQVIRPRNILLWITAPASDPETIVINARLMRLPKMDWYIPRRAFFAWQRPHSTARIEADIRDRTALGLMSVNDTVNFEWPLKIGY